MAERLIISVSGMQGIIEAKDKAVAQKYIDAVLKTHEKTLDKPEDEN